MPLQDESAIKALLEQAKTVAVVGWSNKPDRPSHEVAEALESFGYEIYRVNPTLQSTDNYRVYAQLADIPVKIDIVDVFRRAEDVPEVVEAAIQVGAKAVWMQLGIINDDAAKRAEEAGLTVVMNHCMKADYKRWFKQSESSVFLPARPQ